MKQLLIIVGLLIVCAAGWWLIAPLFINETLDEALPSEVSSNSIQPDETLSEHMNQPVSSIIDTPGHPASGNVRVVTAAEESIIRFENYDGTNGPDLYVYLANDLDANDFVSLGRARANQGNINYQVPSDVDVSDYKYVLTWCRAFGVLFDYAEINP